MMIDYDYSFFYLDCTLLPLSIFGVKKSQQIVWFEKVPKLQEEGNFSQTIHYLGLLPSLCV